MLQSLLGRDSLLGVVHEDPSEQVEELPVEVSVAGDGFLAYVSWCRFMLCNQTYGKLLHGLDVFLGRLVGLCIGVIELVVLEISCRTS